MMVLVVKIVLVVKRSQKLLSGDRRIVLFVKADQGSIARLTTELGLFRPTSGSVRP